jgi:hypothetical protein
MISRDSVVNRCRDYRVGRCSGEVGAAGPYETGLEDSTTDRAWRTGNQKVWYEQCGSCSFHNLKTM